MKLTYARPLGLSVVSLIMWVEIFSIQIDTLTVSHQPFEPRTSTYPPCLIIGNDSYTRAQIMDEMTLRCSIDGVNPIINLISECTSLHSSANIHIMGSKARQDFTSYNDRVRHENDLTWRKICQFFKGKFQGK